MSAILRRPAQGRVGILRCCAAKVDAPRDRSAAADEFIVKFVCFKLKCKNDCVSVLTLRGEGVLNADRQQQRSQTKKAVDNQEEYPE